MTQTTPSAPQLTFDVVIATRNRPDALALSIPLILQQSRLPQKVIVIDSSDDHTPVAEIVAATTADWVRDQGGEVIVEHTAKGLPRQRNRGLSHVTADVVIFPDDDSLFHPGVSQAILETYEADTEGAVAGVCAAETMTPPAGVLEASAYEMTSAHKREATTRRLRNRLERRFSQLKPTLYLGQLLRDRRPRPAWMNTTDYSLVEYMTGFRMSFRSAVIKAETFDETLIDYAVDEDIDASLSAARHGLIVGALKARIFHHRFPGGRGNAYTLGIFTVLNRAYVMHKHIAGGGLSTAEAATARSRLRMFTRLKLMIGLLGARSAWGREHLKGAWKAAREARKMEQMPADQLSDAYRAAQKRLGL